MEIGIYRKEKKNNGKNFKMRKKKEEELREKYENLISELQCAWNCSIFNSSDCEKLMLIGKIEGRWKKVSII